jgi:hypothetical protein
MTKMSLPLSTVIAGQLVGGKAFFPPAPGAFWIKALH